MSRTNGPDLSSALDDREILLVVGRRSAGEPDWISSVESLFPRWRARYHENYLSAIADAARGGVRAILAHVDPELPQLENAVSGLRLAAGASTRLVLCCTPELEPLARRVRRGGADDYVLLPLRRREADSALQYVRPNDATFAAGGGEASASMREIGQIAEMLAVLDQRPMALLERLSVLVKDGLNAKGATVIVEGAVATSGDVVTKPVMSASLTNGRRSIGQLTVSERATGSYTPADGDKLRHYAALASRILEAGSAYRQVRQLSLTDETTQLPNRRFLKERLDEILARAQRERFPVTLLLFDVDGFKEVNDRFGHDAGDAVLRDLGGLFRQFCREGDVVARYGGDEFAVVFWDPDGPRVPGSTPPESPMAVLDRVREALRGLSPMGDSGAKGNAPRSAIGLASDPSPEPRVVPGSWHEKGHFPVQITISGGLATYPWDANTRDALLQRADEALLTAKREGKNRVYVLRGRA